MFKTAAWKSILLDRSATAKTSPNLRIVEQPAPVIPFRRDQAEDLPRRREIVAEIRSKRFPAQGVEEERFAATLHLDDLAPVSVLAALQKAIANVEVLRRSPGPDDALILEFRIRAS